jgi:hypothetical protein
MYHITLVEPSGDRRTLYLARDGSWVDDKRFARNFEYEKEVLRFLDKNGMKQGMTEQGTIKVLYNSSKKIKR